VGVDEYVDAVLLGLSHDLFELFEVSVIVLTFLGLKALPGDEEADGVNAPFLQVLKIFFNQGVIEVEFRPTGEEGFLFVYNIKAVSNTISSKLVLHY
jgi:hypothetical protein